MIAVTLAHGEESFNKVYPGGLSPEAINFHAPDPADLALINYTSGSTGNSKGVMLTYGNLSGNIEFALGKIDFLNPGDGMVSMLPLAHMYGLVLQFPFL